MNRIPSETWQQIQTAHASGIGLRQLARNMNIPAGTVLARAKRECWTRQIQDAKALAVRPSGASTVTPTQAAAMSLQERGERHVGRVAGITEQMLTTFERLSEPDQLRFVDKLETVDKIGRRTYG